MRTRKVKPSAAPPASARRARPSTRHKMDPSTSTTSPWAAARRGLLAALYYVTASVSLTLFNKLLFQRYPVTSPVLVLFSQAAITLLILTLLAALRIPATCSPASLTRAQHSAHVPLFLSYIGMLLFGLAALQETSLLMYHTLRRTSIVPVLVLQVMLGGARPTKATLVAALLVVGGAFAAVATNLRFEMKAYVLAGLANFATAYYLVKLKDVRDELMLSNLQLLFLNNVYAMPFLFGVLIMMPPGNDVWMLFRVPEFCLLFASSASFALVLNHAVYVNTTVNDAVAHTISTQVKDVILLVVSILFVDNPTYRSRGMLDGAFIAFAGSLVYAVGKLLANFGGKKAESKLVNGTTLKRPLVKAEGGNEDEDDTAR